ncbi:MAG: hypothetical protein ACKVZJ_10970 [Phycisphaerales bacterium]
MRQRCAARFGARLSIGAAWVGLAASAVPGAAVYDPDGSGPASAALAAAGALTSAGGVTVTNIALLVAPPSACAGDVTGDGAVNTEDLVGLLGDFGGVFVTGTPADLNGDGVVNTLDLTTLLGAFGAACR